jgi:hypothetical protein
VRPTLVLSGGERSLLGLAFAPDYATSGRFFVNYTRKPDGQTVIGRYRRSDTNPLRAVTAAAGTIPIIARRTPVTCSTSPEPFLSSGGGVFVGGTWVTRSSPLAAGAGLARIDTSSCTTARPAADWVCVKGNWLPPWYPLP